jgi:hypothetical protein
LLLKIHSHQTPHTHRIFRFLDLLLPPPLRLRLHCPRTGPTQSISEEPTRDTRPPARPGPVDTTAFEIRRLEAAFGPLLPAILGRTGLTELRTREDIDRIAALLRGSLLA